MRIWCECVVFGVKFIHMKFNSINEIWANGFHSIRPNDDGTYAPRISDLIVLCHSDIFVFGYLWKWISSGWRQLADWQKIFGVFASSSFWLNANEEPTTWLMCFRCFVRFYFVFSSYLMNLWPIGGSHVSCSLISRVLIEWRWQFFSFLFLVFT